MFLSIATRLYLLKMQFFAALGQGHINEVNIPVQEFGGQRREGAYFLENMVYNYGY